MIRSYNSFSTKSVRGYVLSTQCLPIRAQQPFLEATDIDLHKGKPEQIKLGKVNFDPFIFLLKIKNQFKVSIQGQCQDMQDSIHFNSKKIISNLNRNCYQMFRFFLQLALFELTPSPKRIVGISFFLTSWKRSILTPLMLGIKPGTCFDTKQPQGPKKI